MMNRESSRIARVAESTATTFRNLAELVFLEALFVSAAKATADAFLVMMSLGTTLALMAYSTLLSIRFYEWVRPSDTSRRRWYVAVAIGLAFAAGIGQLTSNAVDALIKTALTKA